MYRYRYFFAGEDVTCGELCSFEANGSRYDQVILKSHRVHNNLLTVTKFACNIEQPYLLNVGP